MIGYILGAGALSMLVWLADGVRRIGAVSRGNQIGKRTETALLLIDLQTVFWESGHYSETSKSAAETAILEEIAVAKKNGHPIIAMRQEWSHGSTKAVARLTMKGQAIAGTPGVELAQPFVDQADHVLVKRVQDAFETGELDALLATLDIGALRIVGLDFNYCVQKTALAARNRGYDTMIVARATLSSEPTQKAQERLASNAVVLL